MLICSLIFESGKVSSQPDHDLICDESYAGITDLPAPVLLDDVSMLTRQNGGVSETHCYLNLIRQQGRIVFRHLKG